MKILDGKELAGFIKERQAQMVRGGRTLQSELASQAQTLETEPPERGQAPRDKKMERKQVLQGGLAGRAPRLAILRDNDDPVIEKYVGLKKRYGEDIGVKVNDFLVENRTILSEKIAQLNADEGVDAIIVQLPLRDCGQNKASNVPFCQNNGRQPVSASGTADRPAGMSGAEAVDDTPTLESILSRIAPEKDVDGLSGKGNYDPATATAINWLLAGYGVELADKKIAIVGRGRLVGAPLARMWRDSGLDVTVFHRGDDLARLADYEVIVSATGVPGLIKPEMVAPGAVVVDAGTASEAGIILGDVDEVLRERKDLAAITPKLGGVGPLTVAALFENVITARNK